MSFVSADDCDGDDPFDYSDTAPVQECLVKKEAPPPTILFPKKEDHSRLATIIYIHGLGGSAKDGLAFAQRWQARWPHVKVVLPSAPSLAITMNYGIVLPAWHDVFVMGGDARPPTTGWPGLRASVARVRALVHAELDMGTPPGRIVLAGFSQGAALAAAALYHIDADDALGGLVMFSGFMPAADRASAAETVRRSRNASSPVFIGHGEADEIVTPIAAIGTKGALLDAATPPVTFNLYPGMAHTVAKDELDDVDAFLEGIVG